MEYLDEDFLKAEIVEILYSHFVMLLCLFVINFNDCIAIDTLKLLFPLPLAGVGNGLLLELGISSRNIHPECLDRNKIISLELSIHPNFVEMIHSIWCGDNYHFCCRTRRNGRIDRRKEFFGDVIRYEGVLVQKIAL